jgi:nucleotide-binding universal stress UspA family protein
LNELKEKKPLDRILVAYDHSEEAVKALEHATNLVEEDDELIIIMVIPSVKDEVYGKSRDNMKVSEGRNILKEVEQELKERGIKTRTVVKKGDVADTILEIGNEYNCKLIVIGYKGISKIGRFSLGSVIDRVSRNANRPILMIK